MEMRQRGNPAGNTNLHVAANMRAARQAIGMDLRTFAEQVKEAGRAMSASALSKIENGDRRVDVDDLTVFAYVLRTTPAALITPPHKGPAPTGVPDGQHSEEELRMWVHGRVKLTTEDLVRYWKEEWFKATSYVKRFEDQLALYDKGQVGITPREVYEDRLRTQQDRLDIARSRIFELDPTATPYPD
ncbi:helix-turn-helix domain-containing protein [Nocardioides acrostichi]|uniref:Helix-turn-helix transcriptional regulator n=1 Tax=Nocardioides acrostichi TaxID=2784339 RepID=A0A930V1G9_9ACTN|nr:helix-turn-helix transcriptional regulator [Nocardioides acrostichi]MBF4163976.1 helix-turn-helix transcriptional regulator [Nocardioides acrostichi]